MNTPGPALRHGMLPLLFLCLLLASCRHGTTHVRRAFYYWKSEPYWIRDTDQDSLLKTGMKKLYVKVFEVVPDPAEVAIPAAKSSLHINRYDTLAKVGEIVPVVFIRNEALQHITRDQLDTLADNIVFLARKYAGNLSVGDPDVGGRPLHELQIDCDWTSKTRDNYFYLLRAIKRISKLSLSCTLRLYPYKYRAKMGVPPVDRAMLMCYNLISPTGDKSRNSILDPGELKSYLNGPGTYPLPLDVALPLFSWMQVYRYNKLYALISKDQRAVRSALKELDPLWYEVTQDTVLDGCYLRPGDRIKYERISTAVLQESIDALKKNVHFGDSTTVSFFHYDNEQLQQYSYATLDSLYNRFTD